MSDTETFNHCMNVGKITSEMLMFTDQWDEKEKEEIVAGALVHDVGKLWVPLSLTRVPWKLTNEEYDIVLIDTAGRLQNKVNLMNELEKINRVISGFIENAPHETLLVIDATTGQNGISQAKSFKEITNITGIVLTKLDGTAKGGIVLAIKEEVNIPVKYIGLGEKAEDLESFDIEKYIYGLFKEMM